MRRARACAMHAHAHACTFTCMHMHMHMHMHTHMHAHAHAHAHAHFHGDLLVSDFSTRVTRVSFALKLPLSGAKQPPKQLSEEVT